MNEGTPSILSPNVGPLEMFTMPTSEAKRIYEKSDNILSNFSFLGLNDTIGIFSDANGSDLNMNATRNNGSMGRGGPPPWDLSMKLQIPAYALIFLLSVVGNILVIVTVVQNKKMRSVTNVFLLNLSVSDLLLAVFCMPFTLVPIYLRNFIFGEVMCIAVRYMQGSLKC
ncbi:cholecystokinin receptor type a [Plakobranchus ocellatus]|uniref:Cholecystokinin receptor type a n=1 Tax=Plakobranchus ocellatus TaxID=259542 RepID=A0AAV3XQ05_9GAST|nr:cholecystokinin receptor type a [Plakobranchus ocellatus]